jgi:flagellar FliL protein
MSDAPAEEAPAADGHAKPAKPKGGTSPIVMALLVLNLGASGFGVFKLMTASPAAAAPAPVKEEKSGKEITGPVIALDPFVVNLDEPGNARYLKMTAQLELVGEKDGEAIEKSKQVIRDEVLGYLSGLHVKDTLGAGAKEAIREALMKKLEANVGEHKIRRMFFQEFMVQ